MAFFFSLLKVESQNFSRFFSVPVCIQGTSTLYLVGGCLGAGPRPQGSSHIRSRVCRTLPSPGTNCIPHILQNFDQIRIKPYGEYVKHDV